MGRAVRTRASLRSSRRVLLLHLVDQSAPRVRGRHRELLHVLGRRADLRRGERRDMPSWTREGAPRGRPKSALTCSDEGAMELVVGASELRRSTFSWFSATSLAFFSSMYLRARRLK